MHQAAVVEERGGRLVAGSIGIAHHLPVRIDRVWKAVVSAKSTEVSRSVRAIPQECMGTNASVDVSDNQPVGADCGRGAIKPAKLRDSGDIVGGIPYDSMVIGIAGIVRIADDAPGVVDSKSVGIIPSERPEIP